MNQFRIFLLAVLLFATTIVQAQSKSEKEVTHAVEQLRQAMVTPDSLKLESVLSNALSYGHSGGHIESKASLMGNLLSGKSDFVRIDLTEQTVQILGNTAIVRHTLDGDTNDNGKPAQVKLSVLTVWQKEKKDWKMVARQAVKLAH
jgi:hypothetical protein